MPKFERPRRTALLTVAVSLVVMSSNTSCQAHHPSGGNTKPEQSAQPAIPDSQCQGADAKPGCGIPN